MRGRRLAIFIRSTCEFVRFRPDYEGTATQLRRNRPEHQGLEFRPDYEGTATLVTLSFRDPNAIDFKPKRCLHVPTRL